VSEVGSLVGKSGDLKNLRPTGWSIENRLFTEWRLALYGSGVGVFYFVVLASLLLKGQWVIRGGGKIANIDFGRIWISGNLAQSSDPMRVFDNSAFSAAQLALFGPDGGHLFPFVYPPMFLLFTYPLGLLPYLAAFAVWMVATLALYQAAIYTIIPRPAALILALTPCPVLFNLGLGQNGFLTAGLVGLSLALTERQPWLSGIFLGLLTYKPQFGILFPFALLASRNWRALIGAAVTSIFLGVTAAIAFGFQGWGAFLHSLINRQSSLAEIPGWQPPLVSILGLFRSAGASAYISWTVHLAAAAIVAVTICVIWTKPIPHSLKAAALCIGSVMVTPYVLGYDLCVLSIATAFLVKDGLSRGFLPGERVVMLVCWAGLIFMMAPAIPIAICVALLILIARRIGVPPGANGQVAVTS
jgi:hypothetical protein